MDKLLDVKTLLFQLNVLWANKSFKEIDLKVATFFETSKCLWLDCLDLVHYSKDKKRPESLGSYIIDRFILFLKSKTQIPLITEEVKEKVLDLVTISHPKLSAKLITCFEVDKPSLELVLQFIVNLSTVRGDLNNAITLITILNLQDQFSIFDVAVPILMQNKLSLLDQYMHGSEKVQLEMIKLLDSWLSEGFDMAMFCSNHSIRFVRDEVLRPQFQERMLKKWLRMFDKENISEQLCPNLRKRQALGAIKYVMFRYYVEESTSFENMVDLLTKTAGEDEWLQNQLLDMLQYTYQDYEALDIFKSLYNIEKPQHKKQSDFDEEDDWGCTSNSNSARRKSQSQLTATANHEIQARTVLENSKEKCYELNLPMNSVVMVDDKHSLDKCIACILQRSYLVGIDAEWLFSLSLNKSQSVALLQLATKSNVFLIDMFTMLHNGDLLANVTQFLSKLFLSKRHIKVGFGLREDVKKLCEDMPGLENKVKQLSRIVDLHVATQHMQRLFPHLFESISKVSKKFPSSSKQTTGLSKLVEQIFGVKLDKSEQISDWEQRPLRNAQIKYAALDAYCLVEIYEILSFHLSKLTSGVTLENIVNHKPAGVPPAKNSYVIGRGRGHPISRREISKPDTKKPVILVPDFRVVCDNMLQGLGRHLRCCGIDTVILTNLDCHDKAIGVAQKDKRVILTSGTPYQLLSQHVPAGSCFNVPNDMKAKEQLALIIQHFNVKVSPSDIFSRCPLCNCGKYLQVSASEMFEVVANRATSTKNIQVPWDEFQKQVNIGDRSYSVVVDDDDSGDDIDNVYMFDEDEVKVPTENSALPLNQSDFSKKKVQ